MALDVIFKLDNSSADTAVLSALPGVGSRCLCTGCARHLCGRTYKRLTYFWKSSWTPR